MKNPKQHNPFRLAFGLLNRFVALPLVILLLLWFYAGEIACTLWGLWDSIVQLFN